MQSIICWLELFLDLNLKTKVISSKEWWNPKLFGVLGQWIGELKEKKEQEHDKAEPQKAWMWLSVEKRENNCTHYMLGLELRAA